MALVLWSDAALRDFRDIFTFTAERNPLAAARVSKELLLAGDSVTSFPRRGRLRVLRGERELASVRPYVLVYEIGADEVVRILRVWHAAQDRA